MKKMLQILVCAGTIGCLTGCGLTMGGRTIEKQSVAKKAAQEQTTTQEQTDAGEQSQIPSPIVEYDSMEQAEDATGFSFSVPETVDGYKTRAISVISEEIFQVIYTDASGDRELTLRKAAGTEDVSGDYNEYREQQEVTVGAYSVMMKGNDGAVFAATWTSDGYFYSVMSDGEMTTGEMSELIESIS